MCRISEINSFRIYNYLRIEITVSDNFRIQVTEFNFNIQIKKKPCHVCVINWKKSKIKNSKIKNQKNKY